MSFIYECVQENSSRIFTVKFIKKYVFIWEEVKSLTS